MSARELHKFLDVETPYHKWFPRMAEYGFIENSDYLVTDIFVPNSNGGKQTQIDHQLTIEMGKEIAMLQRNEKGKQARTYFIELEKAWNTPEQVMARAIKIANHTISNLKLENNQQKQMLNEFSPKASYYDVVLQTADVLSIGKIAKDYGKSAIWINAKLHDLGIQFKQGGVWLLYQKYAEQGYTKSKTETYSGSDGNQHSRLHTYWTQKGRLFLYELLKSQEVLPTIEQEQKTA